METNRDNQLSKEINVEILDKVQEYIKSMTPKDYLAYTIAKEHLGTSFTVEKSVGYYRWLKEDSK
jgi:hypothetical protein